MATSRIAFQTQIPLGMPDGATNTHVRKQIQRIRLSKGWTRYDLEEAAGIAADSLEDLEAGIRRISVDTLQKIIEALECDIADVWPSVDRVSNVQSTLPNGRASDPLNFSRLAEIHSLTQAEASCMFIRNDNPVLTGTAAKEGPATGFQVLSSINLEKDEMEWLFRNISEGASTGPWVTYLYRANGRGLYLCIKNGCLTFWAESFIECCLSAWLAVPAT